jgi:hypothetical protein
MVKEAVINPRKGEVIGMTPTFGEELQLALVEVVQTCP